jgi:hypothetical protein
MKGARIYGSDSKSLEELTNYRQVHKRLTGIEEEFTFMKQDLKRVKSVLQTRRFAGLETRNPELKTATAGGIFYFQKQFALPRTYWR